MSAQYAEPPVILGALGMVKITYVGDGTIKVKGGETCHWYEFSPSKACWVDKRDAPALLKFAVNDKPVFLGA